MEKYKAGECMSYFRMQKDYSGTEKCGSDLPKNTGETLYRVGKEEKRNQNPKLFPLLVQMERFILAING
jgi:hypothetical protein